MTAHRRAFSLIELLLSVFILAIGIISISALFPAGIAQQQMANDDQLGPIVAEHAVGTLRSRLRQEDFGTFEEYGIINVLKQSADNGSYVFRPAPGDWSWIRPSVIVSPNPDIAGVLDVFSSVLAYPACGLPAPVPGATDELAEFPGGVSNGNRTLYGIPYNPAVYGCAPPRVITQRERYWPVAPEGVSLAQPPQYCWDVMFRRFGGKVQVAVFVYRVVGVGGASKPYVTKAMAGSTQPPVPYRRVLKSIGTSYDGASTGSSGGLQVRAGWTQPSDAPFATGILGTAQGLVAADFPAAGVVQPQHTWQMPGQWLLDSNGNVLRVLQGRRTSVDPVSVRLTNPVPRVPQIQAYDDYEKPASGGTDNVPQGIRALYFVPAYDADGHQLIPVYCTVRDL